MKLPATDKRLTQMQQGMQELHLWLKDLLRQGLATLENQPAAFWDDLAARMVDSKLGNIARQIRLMKTLFERADWHEELLTQLADLYLMTRAYEKFEQLPADLQMEVLTISGLNIKKETVLQQKGIKDIWLVTAQREGFEEKLRYQKTYYWSATSQKAAMQLDYAWRNDPFPDTWKPGSMFKGEMVYYPGAFPLRALIKNSELEKDVNIHFSGFDFFSELLDSYARALAENPWVTAFPALLSTVIPIKNEDHFLLVDAQGQKLQLDVSEADGWKIVALGGGRELSVFGEWENGKLRPLSVFSESGFVGKLGLR